MLSAVWRQRMHLTIHPRVWAMTSSHLRTRLRFTQILPVRCGRRNHSDIFWGSDTNNGAWNTKSFFTINPQGDTFFQVQSTGIFFFQRVQSKAFQWNGMLLYKKLIIHMEEPGSQNNVDSASFQNMNCLTYSHLRGGLFFFKTAFLGEVGKPHSWF